MPIDYKRYPPNWGDLRMQVLRRSNGVCEHCGLLNYSVVYGIKLWIKEVNRYKLRSLWFRDERDAKREADGPIRKIRVVLTIAHLDHDETNHEVTIERLSALCQMCHLRYDANEKFRRVKEKWTNK